MHSIFYFQICSKHSPTPIKIRECPSTTPYCTTRDGNDYCTASRDINRSSCFLDKYVFECTDAGYFPDPTDCNAYYVCVPRYGDSQFNAERIECGENSSYNSKVRRCAPPHVTSNPCNVINCRNGSSAFEPYPSNSQYFYNCVEKSTKEMSGKQPVMYRCPSTLTGTPAAFGNGTCTYSCPGRGRYEVTDSRYNFIECSAARAIGRLEECPYGHEFNSTNGRCHFW